MSNTLEVLIPVRNPGRKLLETAASLLAQTDRKFRVCVSDNLSTQGMEFTTSFLDQLRGQGIEARLIQAPRELGRVQHWNWIHSQSEADWLKPLLVGDLLEPTFVAALQQRIRTEPRAKIVRFDVRISKSEEVGCVSTAPFSNEFMTPIEFLDWFPKLGNWVGGLVNIAYERAAWMAAGGFMPHLPVSADLNLHVSLILRHGLACVHEPLTIFQLYHQRLSHEVGRRHVNETFELWLILRQSRNYCESVGLPWPKSGIIAGVCRQLRSGLWIK